MPPAVEPAQPPIKLTKMRKIGKNPGHDAYSVVVKPPVVLMDTA